MSAKRVFVCGIRQESNSFNPCLCKMEMFFSNANRSMEESLIAIRKDKASQAAGSVSVLDAAGYEVIYGLQMGSGSYGPLDNEVVSYFLHTVSMQLKNAGKIDGVILNLHGATISEKSDDVCGDIAEAIRSQVGEDVVISASFDLHASITKKLLKNVDYVSGYHTYPHIDLYQTGERAAKRLVEHISGKTKRVAASFIPMIAPAHGYTDYKGKFGELVSYANSLVENGKITDYSFFEVQPWLDIPNIATAVIVIAEDAKVAKEVVADLSLGNLDVRKELLGEPLFGVDEIISKALENKTGRPTVLVDSADSPNAGANADSAFVIEKLIPYKDILKSAVAVSDVPAVEKAFSLGVGAVSDFSLGATVAPKLSSPVTVKNAKVVSLHSGDFYRYGPGSKGVKCSLGRCAVLEVGKIFIHLSERGSTEGDINFYNSFGIDPRQSDFVAVKACTSFRAGYEPIADGIYNTNTPGAAGVVLTDLPYERRPVPLYPFEEITEKDITEPECFRYKEK